MWTCPECGRVFARSGQQHSCRSVPLDEHFRGRDAARLLFDALLERIRSEIGPCLPISIPCCIHLFGSYDFLAALPKRDSLEIRFALAGRSPDPRFEHIVPLSSTRNKHTLHIRSIDEIDHSLMTMIDASYRLRG